MKRAHPLKNSDKLNYFRKMSKQYPGDKTAVLGGGGQDCETVLLRKRAMRVGQSLMGHQDTGTEVKEPGVQRLIK